MNILDKNPSDGRFIVKDSYSLVLALFCCSLLMHFLLESKGIFVLPIILLLINYKWWLVSLVNIIIGLIYLISNFPRQGNHANIETFIGFFILLLFLNQYCSRKTLNISSSLLSIFFRIFTVCIYFYAGFHKLNSAFLDMSVSCANDYTIDITNTFFENETISLLNFLIPYAVIVIEMVVPFGLFWYKSRKVVSIILIVFHLYLIAFSFGNFSALAFFLILASLIDFDAVIPARIINLLKIYMLSVLLCACYNIFKIDPVFLRANYTVIFAVYILTFSVGAILFFAGFLKEYIPKRDMLRLNHFPILISLIIFVSFWGLKNYIGLGTIGNFTMFSNLVTESNRSNHFIIDTKFTKIFPFEEDNVRILRLDGQSKWKKQQILNFTEILIPTTEFSYLIHEWSENSKDKINCTLVYRGQIFEVEDLRTSKFSVFYWWYKFIPFRVIQVNGQNICRW